MRFDNNSLSLISSCPTGAHLQADEEWQLCALPPFKCLPGLIAGKEEGICWKGHACISLHLLILACCLLLVWKWKYCFLFLKKLFNENFCFLHQGHRVWHPYAQPQHMCLGKQDGPRQKKNQKKQQPEMCLSCTTVSQMQCRQLKLHCLFLVTKMVSAWETELINLLIGLANFTHCGFHLLSLSRWSSLWMPYL